MTEGHFARCTECGYWQATSQEYCSKCGAFLGDDPVVSGERTKPELPLGIGSDEPLQAQIRRPSGKRIAVAAALALVIILCVWAARAQRVARLVDYVSQDNAPAVYVTSEPTATFAPPDTRRAAPTSEKIRIPIVRPASAESDYCIPWQQAKSYVGSNQCVCGTVDHTKEQNSIFFVHFSNSSESFYGMSYQYVWDDMEGNCVLLCGEIVENYGRPRMILDQREGQVFHCLGVPTGEPTLRPTAKPTDRPKPEATATAECLRWQEAGQYVGQHRCVCGKVTHTYYDSPSGAFFIDFTEDRSAFYVVSFDYQWPELEGYCGKFCGEIRTYEGRPQMIYEDWPLPPCP